MAKAKITKPTKEGEQIDSLPLTSEQLLNLKETPLKVAPKLAEQFMGKVKINTTGKESQVVETKDLSADELGKLIQESDSVEYTTTLTKEEIKAAGFLNVEDTFINSDNVNKADLFPE